MIKKKIIFQYLFLLVLIFILSIEKIAKEDLGMTKKRPKKINYE